jgi:predicted glutamine amidotransferase
MCRLFGILSQDPINAPFLTIDAPASLLYQSHVDKKRLQRDGWGIGWFRSGRPEIFKRPRAIYKDMANLRRAVKRPKGHVLLGHVRWASNPLKLPRRELIGPAHTQPFKHGEWLFVHNGTLLIPRETQAQLGPWAKYVQGKNDSEVLFYWLLKTVVHGSGGHWAAKVRRSLTQLDRIWSACRERYPIYKHPYHGLNWVLTNGRRFLAFCYVNSNGFDKGKALAHRQQPYYQLQMKISDRDILVASEPLTAETGWRPLGHGNLLVAEHRNGKVSSRILKVI